LHEGWVEDAGLVNRLSWEQSHLLFGGLLRRILAAATLVAVATGCAPEPPPVSDKVQAEYEKNRALAPSMSAQPQKPVAVFLGDSYTQGTGASAESKRWTALVAAQMGWAENNKGRGGTRYLNTSDQTGCGLSFCPNIEAMAPEAIASSPKIVVVAGGQNDFTSFIKDPGSVTDKIDSTYRNLRQALPDAKIIAVGPSSPWGVGGPTAGIDKAVQAAALAVNAKYVSLISPDVIQKSMILTDGAHVNDSGHAAIAERVMAALR
jgi:lysophospholipase L1-like esterase